ncbi:MAG TPA: S1-like domain-containing RNA-binding protein [Oligoflexia bacterium]|nr:S1-like domain-containing RNA-binding protein [Oligoflexia bacterium]HMR25570.1 S1-like domain-containing RNA-binding protein [Oligoflexia bacterium]
MNRLLVEHVSSKTCVLKDPKSLETINLKQSKQELKENSMLDVFVYKNKEGQAIASLDLPYAYLGEYGFLEMVGQSQQGAYFDLGLEEDLLVPHHEQNYHLKIKDIYIIRICIDPSTNRLYGSTDQKAHLKDFPYSDIEENHFVSLIPVERTELGYKVIINQKYLGMIYHNEIFTDVQCSELYQGVIKKIREDGLIDAALQKQGFSNVVQAKITIINHLKKNNGQSELTDKSSPELIRTQLGMSKKTFKNALGMLYKEKKVALYPDRTELIIK